MSQLSVQVKDMALTNREIAAIFEDIADMLLIKGENIHRVMAYRNAATSIRELPRDLRTLAAEGQLESIPSVGKVIGEKIEELLETGRLNFYDQLAAEIPPGVLEILRINGVGPKRAYQFWKEAGITSIDALEEAAAQGKLRNMSGMGAKSEAKILAGIEALRRRSADARTLLGIALPTAETMLARLLEVPGVSKGAVAGSIRRARPTIGDIDLLVTADDSSAVMDVFVSMESVARVLGHGSSKSSVELHNGLQVDLRVLPAERWGTALCYFTGSQAHNIHLRELARSRGLSLNEHAFTRLDDDAVEILCATEEEVYSQLGLSYIPPELREDFGEIELAAEGKLPALVELGDIAADLHMHTVWSDGKHTIRAMAEAAKERGRRYIVITDHSRSATIANGLSIDRLLEQQAEVRQIDAAMNGSIRVFHGIELEIRADGTLDFPDEILEQLDFVIASLHVSLGQPRPQITKRLLNAINNPHVDLIGHPRGQLLLERDPADLDMDAIFSAAQASGIALEINANPHRLDLEAQYARRAVALGIPLSVNTDAHDIHELDLMRFGVMTARRGWVEPHAVINTWPVERFTDWVKRRGTQR